MLDKLNFCWRIVATGTCFALFGIGGLFIWFVFYPTLSLLHLGNPHARTRAAKSMVQRSFRLFAGLMALLGVISYEVRGRARLARQGMLVIANHPTLIDVVLLIALIDRADCLVKGALVNNPFTRGPIRAAGYICNNTGTGMLQECIASIRSGNNLIIFPEGTRTPLIGRVKLQRGASNIAVRGGIDLTPIRIHCSETILTKGSKWYHVPRKKAHFLIDIGEDIRVSDFMSGGQAETLAARHLTDHLATYYSRETQRAPS